MEGRTRSGGRWPSMNVLMLTITFSPMSMRPSIVAEPICGSSVTLPALARRDELRADRRLVLEHVEAGAGDVRRPRSFASARVLVDHLAARGVDDDRRPGEISFSRRAESR